MRQKCFCNGFLVEVQLMIHETRFHARFPAIKIHKRLIAKYENQDTNSLQYHEEIRLLPWDFPRHLSFNCIIINPLPLNHSF